MTREDVQRIIWEVKTGERQLLTDLTLRDFVLYVEGLHGLLDELTG